MKRNKFLIRLLYALIWYFGFGLILYAPFYFYNGKFNVNTWDDSKIGFTVTWGIIGFLGFVMFLWEPWTDENIK